MNPIIQFGIQLIQVFQKMSPALDGLMKAFSFLGTIEFYLLLIPLLYWVVDVQLGMRILLVLISTDFLGIAFKQLLHQPRPYWVGDVKPLATETSYGIPSSHASDSLAVWGYLSYRLKKNWLWVVSALLVMLIAFSRMYLGVHFPQDVLGGWVIGLVVIIAFARGEAWALSWLKKLSAAGQIAVGFGISIAMILIGQLVVVLIASFPDPAGWVQFSTEARSTSHYFTLAGALFGTVAGFALMWRHARFEMNGSWGQRAGRYIVGIAGVLILYLALDVLFDLIAKDESMAGYLLRYIRYASVAFWATFGAPWTFLKAKLAQPVADTGASSTIEKGKPVPV